MADPKLRLVALTVLGGALHGRRHNPDEVVTEILVGSDPDCHLVVDLPGISPIHARIWADLDESVVYDTHALRGLWVNATRVEGQAPLCAGDLLWLGPPDDPGSACIECRFAPWVEVLPTSLVDSAPETPVVPEAEPVPVDAAAALAEAFATPEAIVASAEVPAAPEPVPASAEDVTAGLEEAFAAAEEVVATPEEVVATPEEVVATPEEVVATPEDVPEASAAVAPSPEEDPFFVGEGQDAGFVLPPPPQA